MSQHTINRIANVLEAQFSERIDMSDCASRPADQRRQQFLSRALGALCIKTLTDIDLDGAASAVTDGFHDGGLDAIYFDHKNDTLLLVQSKWSDTGNKPLDPDGAGAFVAGVRDLLAGRFDRLNEKIKKKEAVIRDVLYSTRAIKIRLVTAHTAAQSTPVHALRKIEDLVLELNDPVEIATFDDFNQAGIYGLITSESKPAKVKLQIALNDWGVIDRPYLAYYGRVHIGEVEQWWRMHGNNLFTENLRLFHLNSSVNDALRKTLTDDPDNFWYFNNGITLISDSVVKNLAGSPGAKLGLFTCDGVSVVNGAQTVGTIGATMQAILKESREEDRDAPAAWVQARIISLDKCPPDFGRRITRAANLQNAVGNREFAAMDPLQHKLATDFALDKRKYVYKSGEPDPKGDEGCSIAEATQALGCANSIALAVQVKREIGAVWADTDTAPYTDIFNADLTSERLWRSVLVARIVDEELQKLRSSQEIPRADMIAVHMNRIILHLVFQEKELLHLVLGGAMESTIKEAAARFSAPAFKKVAGYLHANHPNEYLASLCKNQRKCEALVNAM